MITVSKSQTINRGDLFFSRVANFSGKLTNGLRNSKLNFFKKFPFFTTKWVLAAVILISVVGAVIWAKSGGDNSDSNSEQAYVSEGNQVKLDKKFSVPIRKSNGEETGQALVVNVNSLQRTERILYKGKPLVAREGKDFIVINIEVENSTNSRLTIRPVDFFRLIGENGKSYAPDIQTDPVKVEPLSSKNTRTIYIVGDDRKNLKFMIGEIKGSNKETVDVVI